MLVSPCVCASCYSAKAISHLRDEERFVRSGSVALSSTPLPLCQRAKRAKRAKDAGAWVRCKLITASSLNRLLSLGSGKSESLSLLHLQLALFYCLRPIGASRRFHSLFPQLSDFPHHLASPFTHCTHLHLPPYLQLALRASKKSTSAEKHSQ